MSQFPHDEFIKEYIPELIQDYGSIPEIAVCPVSIVFRLRGIRLFISK